MTQKEYIGATLKIIGLAVIIYGGVALARNLIQGIYAHHQLSKPSTTYSDSLPADIKMDMDTRITFNSASNRLVAVFYLAHIPSNLVLIIFGLALIKRDRWFTAFLIGKNKDVQAGRRD